MWRVIRDGMTRTLYLIVTWDEEHLMASGNTYYICLLNTAEEGSTGCSMIFDVFYKFMQKTVCSMEIIGGSILSV